MYDLHEDISPLDIWLAQLVGFLAWIKWWRDDRLGFRLGWNLGCHIEMG